MRLATLERIAAWDWRVRAMEYFTLFERLCSANIGEDAS